MIAARENPHSSGPPRTGVAPPSHSSTFRVFARGERPHVARLSRRDLSLEAALAEGGFVIPALQPDEDRR